MRNAASTRRFNATQHLLEDLADRRAEQALIAAMNARDRIIPLAWRHIERQCDQMGLI